jgi:alkyl hydroperoxide reductase subunit AhpC
MRYLAMACLAVSLVAGNSFSYAQQQRYVIKGKIDSSVKGIVVLVYTPNLRQAISDTAVIKDGNFSFSSTLAEPMYAKLILNPPARVDGLPAGAEDMQEFFLEPGQIDVTGTTSLNSAIIKAGPSTAEFRSVMQELGLIGQKGKELAALQNEHQAAGNEAGVQLVRDEVKKLIEQRKTVQENFIKDHPDSYVAFSIWHRKTLRQVIKLPEMDQEFSRFSERIRQSPSGKAVGERIIKSKMLDVGKPAIDFTLPDTDGKKLALSSFKGKNVVLCFWNRDFQPFDVFAFLMADIHKQLKDQDVQLVTVFYNTNGSTRQDWITLLQENSMTSWVNLLDENGISDEGKPVSTVAQTYDLSVTLPQVYLLDKKGVILSRDLNLAQNPVAIIKSLINK